MVAWVGERQTLLRPCWVQTHVLGLPLEPPQSCSSLAPRVFEEAQCGASILFRTAAKVTSFRRSKKCLTRKGSPNVRQRSVIRGYFQAKDTTEVLEVVSSRHS